VTKLSRLDACEDKKFVCRCRAQASSNSSQGVVDDKNNEAGVSSMAPEQYSAVEWTRAKVAVCSVVAPARVSKPPHRIMSALCKVT